MSFTIYPAIDLRDGKVVRLKEGDPTRQTSYSAEPAETAKRWLDAGSGWLHVVNLDAAFGGISPANQDAIEQILKTSQKYGSNVQVGGGFRNSDAVQKAFEMGISRVVLGTMIIEKPEETDLLIRRWGGEKVAGGIDARDGFVKIRGWQEGTQTKAIDLAVNLRQRGFSWIIYTDISRDGMQTGANLQSTTELASASGLNVIASGGVHQSDDVLTARDLGLAGIIIGRALYEGSIDLNTLFLKLSSRRPNC
jgi:phosphoribosylformimino-5-aminoimidazole carboxamide ribotide isomerase